MLTPSLQETLPLPIQISYAALIDAISKDRQRHSNEDAVYKLLAQRLVLNYMGVGAIVKAVAGLKAFIGNDLQTPVVIRNDFGYASMSPGHYPFSIKTVEVSEVSSTPETLSPFEKSAIYVGFCGEPQPRTAVMARWVQCSVHGDDHSREYAFEDATLDRIWVFNHGLEEYVEIDPGKAVRVLDPDAVKGFTHHPVVEAMYNSLAQECHLPVEHESMSVSLPDADKSPAVGNPETFQPVFDQLALLTQSDADASQSANLARLTFDRAMANGAVTHARLSIFREGNRDVDSRGIRYDAVPDIAEQLEQFTYKQAIPDQGRESYWVFG